MDKFLKSAARDFLPPILLEYLRAMMLRGKCNRFEGPLATWEEAAASCTGYDARNILEKVLDATLKVKQGEAAFERDSVVFDEIEYAWPVVTGLLCAAGKNGGKLNVLDFGGALGSSYFQNRRFLDVLPEVRWNVVEQQHYVEAGRKHIQDNRLRFYSSVEDCLRENSPCVILLSSVLQYLESPYSYLDRLCKIRALCLIVDRTPFFNEMEDAVLIQHVPSTIYSASYPIRVFSRQNFKRLLSSEWREIANHACSEGEVRTKSGLRFTFEGVLMVRKQ